MNRSSAAILSMTVTMGALAGCSGPVVEGSASAASAASRSGAGETSTIEQLPTSVADDVHVPTPDDSRTVAQLAGESVVGTGSGRYVGTMYDIDRDGLFDPYVADYSQNGYLDQNLVAANGVLVWLFDVNEDVVPDQYGGDTNADAVPDIWFLDGNEDGALDSYEYDPAVNVPAALPTLPNTLTIDPGDIPIDPPGMAAAVDGLLIPGSTAGMDICTFVNSAGMLGSDFVCVNR